MLCYRDIGILQPKITHQSNPDICRSNYAGEPRNAHFTDMGDIKRMKISSSDHKVIMGIQLGNYDIIKGPKFGNFEIIIEAKRQK